MATPQEAQAALASLVEVSALANGVDVEVYHNAVLDVPAGRATKKSPVASVARPARAPAESAESAVFSVNGRTPPEPTAGVTETLPENAAAAQYQAH